MIREETPTPETRMRSAMVSGLAVVLAFAMACGGGGDGDGGTGPGTGPGPGPGPGTGTNEGSTTNAIDVRDNSFSPTATTVPPGTTVTWTWRGNQQHDVAFIDGTRSELQSSGTYARTFATGGT